MALRRDDLQPPKILRAHRPRTSDALQPLEADVQENVTTQGLPRTGIVQAYWRYVVAGMCIALGFYLLLSRLIIPFVITTQEHWNYGYSRVSVTDLDVGHNGMSHFIAQYYKNQIVIVEMPINHPEQSKIYAVYESVQGGTSRHVATLTTAYVSRKDTPGKPDLIVSVSGFAVPVVLYNTGESFRTGE